MAIECAFKKYGEKSLSLPLPRSGRVPPWTLSLGNCNDVGSSLGPQGRWGSFFWRVGGRSFSIDTTCQSACVIIIPLTIPSPYIASLQASLISQNYLSFFLFNSVQPVNRKILTVNMVKEVQFESFQDQKPGT